MDRSPVVVGVKAEQPTALRFAADAATARGVDLHVIHCLEPLIAGDVVLPVDEPGQAAGQQVLETAKALIGSLDRSPAATYELSIGAPFGILSEAAEKASLVVLGTDEADWGARLFTDKVTERLAKQAEIPVAIVPERSSTHPVGKGIYVALDGRGPATGPLRFAFTEASRRRKSKLHVIHALSAGTPIAEMNDIRAELSEILAGWNEEFPDVQVIRRLVFADTDPGLVATTADASLLVLGRATHRRFGGLFGHPVITEIARHTRGASVVVPNDWKDE